MTDWILELCDWEDLENAKRQHIVGISGKIADSLRHELENCVSAYNERHPRQFADAISAAVSVTAQSTEFLFSAKKNTKPAGEVAITIQINEARLIAKGTGLPNGGVTYTMDPEMRNRHFVRRGDVVEAVYFVQGKRRHRVPELARELLSTLLFPQFCTFTESLLDSY